MGLHCTKQGHPLQDFHDGSFKRYAPEGESFPIDQLLSTSVNTADNVALLFNDLTSFSRKMKIKRENILIGEESLMDCQYADKIVDLPPEGEISQKEYVELPKDQIKKEFNKMDIIESVELDPPFPYEKSSASPTVESVHTEKTGNENTDENQWSYTLYNFEGNGVASKKDLHELVDTICSAVGKDNTLQNNKHSLKIHLQVGHDTNLKNTVKSPNKYTPSKQYKGMIFPPPNSIEAEKVSTYLEEKLSIYKENVTRGSKPHKKLRRHSSNDFRKEFFPQPNYMKKINTCGGSSKCDTRHCSHSNTSPKIKSVHNSPKTNHSARVNTDTVKTHSRCCNHDKNKLKLQSHDTQYDKSRLKPSTHDHSRVKIESHDPDKYRLKHSCKYHIKHREKSNKFEQYTPDQESKRCLQIKHDAKRTLHQYDNDNASYVSSSLTSSSQSSDDPHNNSYPKSKHRSNIPHHNNELQNNTKLTSRDRPAVWPGESCETKQPENIVPQASDLCICKRMCGLDYPCNHASIVHTHKHEHHHYHYYIPNSEKT